MSNTFKFRESDHYKRKSHFKSTEFDYSNKNAVNCRAKTAYESNRLAEEQAIKIMTSIDLTTGFMYNGKLLSTYRCKACKKWHLTSQQTLGKK